MARAVRIGNVVGRRGGREDTAPLMTGSHIDTAASGGRYDALTAVLGAGAFIPAVGGVIRPGLVAGLRGAL